MVKSLLLILSSKFCGGSTIGMGIPRLRVFVRNYIFSSQNVMSPRSFIISRLIIVYGRVV